jgi:hypothetical protein
MHFFQERDIDWNVAIYKYQASTILLSTIQNQRYFSLHVLQATTNVEALEAL